MMMMVMHTNRCRLVMPSWRHVTLLGRSACTMSTGMDRCLKAAAARESGLMSRLGGLGFGFILVFWWSVAAWICCRMHVSEIEGGHCMTRYPPQRRVGVVRRLSGSEDIWEEADRTTALMGLPIGRGGLMKDQQASRC
ncbi:hypothetical protein BDV59DRAFT_187604 [Aspergillus ambiguus]|uniref:uncharacterized protein n=1 Tax=Aspergillus ambiguus TaxID=176160 RepID=UPI003CCD5BB5